MQSADESVTYSNFPAKILSALPEIRDAYEAEVRSGISSHPPTNYVICGEMLHPLIEKAIRSQAHDLLRRIFDFIEILARSDDIDVVNLAQTAVCEFITGTDDRLAACEPYLGPRTRELVEDVQTFLR
jgi:hypothetical protein